MKGSTLAQLNIYVCLPMQIDFLLTEFWRILDSISISQEIDCLQFSCIYAPRDGLFAIV